ncbi:MAG: cation:proton antiporter, partial [Sulfurovaceae bacterium]|nr:cation:proton antiporter [Sulfurovaceae bacterium]
LMISIFTSENSSVSELLFTTLVSAIVVFLILFFVGKFFIERFFDWVISSKSEEIFLGSVILVVIASSVVAELFGFSYSLGAFIAGMTIAETKFRYRIEADLVPFRDILLGVFFVTIGMQIDPIIAWHYGFVILGLLVAIMLTKALIMFVSLRYFVQDRTAIKSSLSLMQVGEFALAIFALAFSHHLISSDINQIMIMTVVLSMVLTPFILNNIKYIANIMFKEPTQLRDRAIESTGFKNHIIVCGYGPIGKKIAKKLKEKNILYLILEHDIKLVDEAIENGEKSIFLANAAQRGVLEHFAVRDSIAVIVGISNQHQIRLICENINSFNANINTIVKVRNSSERDILSDLNITTIINSRDMVSDILVQRALKCELPL